MRARSTASTSRMCRALCAKYALLLLERISVSKMYHKSFEATEVVYRFQVNFKRRKLTSLDREALLGESELQENESFFFVLDAAFWIEAIFAFFRCRRLTMSDCWAPANASYVRGRLYNSKTSPSETRNERKLLRSNVIYKGRYFVVTASLVSIL